VTMVSQGILVPEVCHECSSPTATRVAQHLVAGDLVWTRSRRCDSCGLAEEHDAKDEGMAFFRNLLITDRSYRIEVDDIPKEELTEALRAVSTSATFDTDEVATSLHSGQWRGTRPEAVRLVGTLEKRGWAARLADTSLAASE